MNPCGCFLDFYAKMKAEENTKLIICDESSMIGREVNEDLLATAGSTIKILFIGDHGQLEAVEENPETIQYFGKFDLMGDPDYILSEIHRQAENSPILELAYKARRGEEIDYGIYGQGISKVRLTEDLAIDAADRDLIGITYFSYKDPSNQFHRGRITVSELNASWRTNLGITSVHPIPGERIVCKDYIRSVGIPKGTLATISEVRRMNRDAYGIIALLDDGREYEGLASARQFNTNKVIWGEQHLDKWDYGYALTCHTAQGSEYNSVVVFEPPKGFIKWLGSESYSRWLYTAITRAKRHLLLVG